MNYATFWQRFGAIFIDALVLMPLVFIQVWLESLSKGLAIAMVVPMTAAYSAYSIYCHGRFGQTVGKHAMQIRVVQTGGARIGWRQAWFRSSVDILFASLTAISGIIALSSISDSDYYGVGWMVRAENLNALQPTWLGWTLGASMAWMWSEVLVMLFNKRRRALHDFIAGTVVVSETSE